ncbi:polygalacturonase QRT3 [Coffea eugenioides]|uniref:polygalacturonase QRT3 n=1 Tax=Coffea eugenioides TaxID=49369 RepID=UPI000F614784|nr:polygalacturonase QRT3 [Coffea eugenioides]
MKRLYSSASARLLITIVFFLPLKEADCSLRQLKMYEFQEKIQEKTIFSSIAATPAPSPAHSIDPKKSDGRVFYPIGYGADPSGVADSSDAILEAIGYAFGIQNKGFQLLPGIKDLGGVVIDLQGGNYLISRPLRFPSGFGNILVQGGTLRASNTFPGHRHLIELWSPNSRKLEKESTTIHHLHGLSDREDQNSGIYYEDVTFRDILFDSSYQGGGLFVIDAARIRINNCYFIHFTTQGVLVERGHETFISGCFLGQHETVGGDSGERGFSGTAIELSSTDNAVTDVVIFSAAVGITVSGQANIIIGVHCYNKATYFGGIGILVRAAQTRVESCYLDYNSIVIQDPALVQVSNGYFIGDGNIVLKSINGKASGLNIINNIFAGDPRNMVPIVKLDGEFTDIAQVVIENNIVTGMTLKSTVGKLTVAGNGTQWIADFSSVLVFPNKINHVQYSIYTEGVVAGFPAHKMTNVSNNLVVIESEKAFSGVISVIVDQYNMDGERNLCNT